MEYITEYKKKDWIKRLGKNQKLRLKHPDRIPIILDRGHKNTPKPSSHQFLTPHSFTVAEFIHHVIRKYMPDLKPEQAIFLFFGENNTMYPISATLMQVYTESHSKDNGLFCLVQLENAFG